MNAKMTFDRAVKHMAAYEKSDEAIQAIYDEVEPLCKTDTGDIDNNDCTHLWDWLSETGGYTGTETPESIAQEWDELSEE